jgi:polyhydroxyalkanoate synthase
MGGLLALALGVLRQEAVKGLALLATPWDFHAPTPAQGRMVGALKAVFEDAVAVYQGLPVDLLQSLFSTIDPSGVERKFRTFSRLKARSAKARDFVALEDWLNDGVPLASAVARECLFGWYVDNLPGRGEWCVGGIAVLPQRFIKPAVAMVPANDRIVPPASALALTSTMSQGRNRVLPTGHIGMMAGSRASAGVYKYVADWLTRIDQR